MKVGISVSRFHKHWAASIVAVVALAGCAHLPGMLQHPPPTEPAALTTDDFLSLLQQFLAADSAGRSEIYVAVVSDLTEQPSAENQLRLALLKGWPGHRHSDPAAATQLIEGLLDEEDLRGETRDLATVLRFWIAQRGTDQRLQRSLHARIAELERELEATRQQLAALAEIERMMDPELCTAEESDDCPKDRADPARR